jgi:hypothetical protein
MATTSEETRARRGARQDAAHERLTGTFGDEGDQATQAELAAMRRAARDNPANGNPTRTQGPSDNPEDDLPETFPQRARRVGGANVPGTPTTGQVRKFASSGASGFRRVVTGAGPGRGKGNAGGFVIGLLLYAAGLNFLENGPRGAWSWVKAKFVNDTGAAGPGGGTPASSSTSSTATQAATATTTGFVTSSQGALAPAPSTVPTTSPVAPLPGQTVLTT